MIGIDEVGRGAWAGPLLVAAVRMRDSLPTGLADSKVLAKQKRELLSGLITQSCDIGEGWVEPAEIDELGLTAAMKLAVSRALEALGARNDEVVIMDGHINYCPAQFTHVQCIIDADATHPIVSAASIYAKVARDNYMAELAKQFPKYGFESHVGYGTAAHKAAIMQHGVVDAHRKSYKPIRVLMHEDIESSTRA